MGPGSKMWGPNDRHFQSTHAGPVPRALRPPHADGRAAPSSGLGGAIFEWIGAWYNPRRRHTSLGMLAPAEFEALHTATETGGMINQPIVSGEPGQAPYFAQY